MQTRFARCLFVLLCLGFFVNTVSAETRQYTLYVSAGTLTVNGTGGATLPAWGYSDFGGAPKFPGPMLTANEGDTVVVTVINNHYIDHNFVVGSLFTGAASIPPGGSKTYSFTASNAGTFLYYDSLNNGINRSLGMYGMLWVGPKDGSARAWTDGPGYSFQRLWVLGEMDKPRWNDVAAAGGTVNTNVYRPNYFLINGKGGFDGMGDANTTIDGSVGQVCLARIVNGGQFAHSLHFHGNHVQVLAVNGQRRTSPFRQVDVINIPPLGTADVLFYLNQPGVYPMHIHTAQMETANGVYLNGVATLIIMK